MLNKILVEENNGSFFEKPWQSWLFLGIVLLVVFLIWWYWRFFKKYTITYHSDNRIIEIIKIRVRTEYQDLPLDAPKDTKGRKFLGWYTSARLDELFDAPVMPHHHIHLYARWEEKTNDEQKEN